jgi:hypothetical protein
LGGKNEKGGNKINESANFINLIADYIIKNPPSGGTNFIYLLLYCCEDRYIWYCMDISIETIREVVCASVPEVANKHTYLEAKQSPATRE